MARSKTDDATITDDPTERETMQPADEPMANAPAPPKQSALDVLNATYPDPFDAVSGAGTLDDDFEIMVDTTGALTPGLPVGMYHGRCIGIEPGQPSAKGDTCWIWTFQAVGGDLHGRTTKHWTYTGKGVFKFAEVKTALGFADDEPISPRKIRNRACSWTMEPNIYQGVTKQPRVGVVMPPVNHEVGHVITDDEFDNEIPF